MLSALSPYLHLCATCRLRGIKCPWFDFWFRCYIYCLPSVLWCCWLGGRKGIWPIKTEWWGAGVVSVWSEVQTCIWPSWCHCHSLSLASGKSRLVLTFWYRLTRVVLDKGPLNGCMYICICCLLVYIVCFPTYPLFFTFPYLSPPLVIFSFENRPALVLDRMSWKATKPGFSFFVFILCCSTFLSIGRMHAFVELGLVFFP